MPDCVEDLGMKHIPGGDRKATGGVGQRRFFHDARDLEVRVFPAPGLDNAETGHVRGINFHNGDCAAGFVLEVRPDHPSDQTRVAAGLHNGITKRNDERIVSHEALGAADGVSDSGRRMPSLGDELAREEKPHRIPSIVHRVDQFPVFALR